MPKKKKGKKQHISIYRKVHTWAGLIASLFLLTLSISGIYLNYQEKWHKPQADAIIQSTLLPNSLDRIVARPSGLYKEIGTKKIRIPLPYATSKTSALSVSDTQVYIAFKGGIILSGNTEAPYNWQQLPLPDDSYVIKTMSSSSKGLLIETDTGHHLFNTTTWQTVYLFPPSLHTWMVQLHSGYLWKDYLKTANTLSALLLIFLVITGCIIFLRSLRR
tara:strand:- start:608 stop:1261 length:654 start_codon:yes stop_codon:yes gene_type:complete